MSEKKELMGVKIFARGEKFTSQIKITIPKHYIREIDSIANNLRVPKRYVVWDAIGNHIRNFQPSSQKTGV